VEIIKNLVKNNKLVLLISVLMVFASSAIFAMKRSFKGDDEGFTVKKQKTMQQINQELQEKVNKLQHNQFFVYAEGTSDGVVIPLEVLELSTTMRNLLEGAGGNNQRPIPLYYSIETIRDFF